MKDAKFEMMPHSLIVATKTEIESKNGINAYGRLPMEFDIIVNLSFLINILIKTKRYVNTLQPRGMYQSSSPIKFEIDIKNIVEISPVKPIIK